MSPLNLYARVRILRTKLHTRPRVQRAPGLPCALVSPKSVRMCKRAVLNNRPLLELSPLRPKATEPVTEQGTAPVSSSTRTVARASSPYQARKGVDDDTKRSGCRRYRCCQGQGGCMHSDRNGAEDLPNDRVGATQFDCMASQASGRQGGDGGKRRLRACLGQGVAPDSARSANCRSKTGSQLRGIGWTPCEKR